MATKGKRKLIDIADGSERLMRALENYLKAHDIPYTFHDWGDFRRYYVDSVNLCCASSVIPALQDLARDRGHNA